MTREQLHALRTYISTRINYAIERRLNPHATEIPQWEIDAYEKRFEEIMLDPGVIPTTAGTGGDGSQEPKADRMERSATNCPSCGAEELQLHEDDCPVMLAKIDPTPNTEERRP